MAIPDESIDLVGPPHYAHIATVNADGSPQSSVVWAELRNDRIHLSTGGNYKKTRNMRREPRVAISFHDVANPYRTIEIRGRAEVKELHDYELLDHFAQKYLSLDSYPYKSNNRDGVAVSVSTDFSRVYELKPQEEHKPSIHTDNLLGAPHLGHVATVTAKGQVCSSPVWILEESGTLKFWSLAASLRAKNLRNNPHIAVSVHDESDPMRYTEIRGVAELVEVDHTRLLDRLAKHYWSVEHYPEDFNEVSAVEVSVEIRHQTGFDGRSWRS